MFSQLSALTRAPAGPGPPPASWPDPFAASNPAPKKPSHIHQSTTLPSAPRTLSLNPDLVPIHHLTSLEFDPDQSHHRSCSSTPLTTELETLCQPQDQDRYAFDSLPKRSDSTTTAYTSPSASSHSLSPSSLFSATAHPDTPSTRIPVRTRHLSLSDSRQSKQASHSASTPQLRQPSVYPKPDRRPQKEKDQARAQPIARRLTQKHTKSATPLSLPRKRQTTLPGDLRRLSSLGSTARFSRSPRLEDQLELHQQQLAQSAQSLRPTKQHSREKLTDKAQHIRLPAVQNTPPNRPSRPAMFQSQPMRKAGTDIPGGLRPAPRSGQSPLRLRAFSTTGVGRSPPLPSAAPPRKLAATQSSPRGPSAAARERMLPQSIIYLPPTPARSPSPREDALQLSLIPVRRESRDELVSALERLVGHDRLHALTNVEMLINGSEPVVKESAQPGTAAAPSKASSTGAKKAPGLFGRWGWRQRRVSAADDAVMRSLAAPARQVVFGCALEASEPFSCVTVIGGQKHLIPIVVFATVEEIYARGMSTLGLMRTAGETARLETLVEIFEQAPSYGDGFDVSYESVHVLCGLLKRYLRALPGPLIAPGLFELIWTCCVRPEAEGDADGSDERRVAAAQCLLRLMPRRPFSLLVYLTAFLAQVARFPENKLAPAVLVRIFGPALLGARPLPGALPVGRPTEPVHADPRPAETLTWLLDHWSALTDGLLEDHFVPRFPPSLSMARPPSPAVAEPVPSTPPSVELGIATTTSGQASAPAMVHSQSAGQPWRAPVRAGHPERVAEALASFTGTERSTLPLLSLRAMGFRRHSVSSAQSIVDRYEAKSVLGVDRADEDDVEETMTVVTTTIKRRGTTAAEHSGLDGSGINKAQMLQDACRSMASRIDSLHTTSTASAIVEEPTLETTTTLSSPSSAGSTKQALPVGEAESKKDQNRLETARMLNKSIEVIEAHEVLLKKMKDELNELIGKL